MKWIEKYEMAWATLEKINELRKEIAVLERMVCKAESGAGRITSKLSLAHARCTVSGEDLLCNCIDLKKSLESARNEYSTSVKNLSVNLKMLSDPKDELLLRLLYVIGAEKHVVMAMSDLSPSGFRYKLEKAVAAFDQILKIERGHAA